MEWFHNLFFGNSSFWGGGVAHSVLILALVIALGIALGKLKIGGIRLGVTWILFVGIAFSHFGMQLNEHLVHFVKEFGLILFVYSIGLQVGPSFFSSFKKGGVKLNMLATAIVFLGVIAAYIVHLATGLHITTVVGILSGRRDQHAGTGRSAASLCRHDGNRRARHCDGLCGSLSARRDRHHPVDAFHPLDLPYPLRRGE